VPPPSLLYSTEARKLIKERLKKCLHPYNNFYLGRPSPSKLTLELDLQTDVTICK
jgi:hypothetical protein